MCKLFSCTYLLRIFTGFNNRIRGSAVLVINFAFSYMHADFLLLLVTAISMQFSSNFQLLLTKSFSA